MADTKSLQLETLSLDLMKAVEESCREQSTMPLIKQELRYTIQCRRMSSGQGEMTVQEDEQPEYKLTEEEVCKRYRRREQNRQSSVRCRRKRKDYGYNLEKTITELEKKQDNLKREVRSLHQERKQLERLIKNHGRHGGCHATGKTVPKTATRQNNAIPTTGKQRLNVTSTKGKQNIKFIKILQIPGESDTSSFKHSKLLSNFTTPRSRTGANKNVFTICKPITANNGSKKTNMVSLLEVH